MLVIATLVIAMALQTSPLSALEVPNPPLKALNLSLKNDPNPIPPNNQRRRSIAATVKHRERAIDLGYFKPKPSSPNKVFIEVPRDLRTQAKDIIIGRILKTTRESQTGYPAHSTRLASLAAFKNNITSKEQFAEDTKTIRRQNAANHGSPLKRTPWADIYDEIDENLLAKIQNAIANGVITIVNTKSLNETTNDLKDWQTLWNNNFTQDQRPIAQPHNQPHHPQPPSPPFSHRSDTDSSVRIIEKDTVGPTEIAEHNEGNTASSSDADTSPNPIPRSPTPLIPPSFRTPPNDTKRPD
jgi:hypothetical protein